MIEKTWPEVQEYLNARIEELRSMLERVSDPLQAAEVRGQIKSARRLIAWALEKAPEPIVPPDPYRHA